jgi:hypothetical protein
MSQRTRGQEVTIRISVDGQIQQGSMFKVTDFTVTPRTDLNEADFLGELESDIDIQHHGFDLSWSIQDEDGVPIDLLSLIIDRERTHQKHPDVTITVIHTYRKSGERPRIEVFHDVFIKENEAGFSGRKEYNTHGYEAKAKRRSVLTG